MNNINLKTYLILFLFVAFNQAFCDQIINVGAGGQSTFSTLASPITLGEKITFNFISGTHNAIAVSIPNGANSLSSGSPSSTPRTYEYTPNVIGVYIFRCELHGNPNGISGMVGSFTVTGPVAPSPEITTGKTSSTSACENTTLTFPYTITGTMPTDGSYIVQLSNSSGSFSTPSTLLSSVDGIGNAIVTIPSAISTSSNYRIRLVYSRPSNSIIGTDNGENLTLSSNPTPTASISSSASGSICSNSNVTVTSSINGVQSISSYQWLLNSSLTGSVSDLYISNSFVNNDNLKLIATVLAGGVGSCPSFQTILTSNGINFSILDNVTPTVTISSIDSFVDDCLGHETFYVLSVNSSGLGSSPLFKWYVNNLLTTFTGPTITISEFSSSVFLKAESSLNCVSVTTVLSNELTFPELTVIKESYVEYKNNELRFFNTIFSNQGKQFQWLLNGIPVPGATTNPYTPTQSGTYKCIITFTGCVATITGINNSDLTITLVGTNTSTDELETEISISPNPTTGKIFVAVSGIVKSELTTYIYDLDGKMRISKPFEAGICKGGKGKQCLCPGLTEIDLSSLNSGTYIVFVTNGIKTLAKKKIVKQ